ncbi:helix-turn-helix domain-containing protein [Rouxiella sp. WC2420]|uniref:helix-turn-helix domain-containing protein n=1 Tax=Rouxiella sp. WC2420 TaxID=3234145 RepID=UPI00350FED8F
MLLFLGNRVLLPRHLRILIRRWPKGEGIIAEFLGLRPEQIWPIRYEYVKNSK